MHLLSIGKVIEYSGLSIDTIETSDIETFIGFEDYDYIIIHGGDGTIRRILQHLHSLEKPPVFILNPTGSFNVVAKIHRVPSINTVLSKIVQGIRPNTHKHHIFKLNEKLFLFSAGNMGDLQHIFLSETLRFGILKHGIAKYILAVIFLLPAHLVMTPFMLMSRTRFFIFTPARKLIKRLGSFYGEVPQKLSFDLDNEYNMLELDGDIVTVYGKHIEVSQAGNVKIVTQ